MKGACCVPAALSPANPGPWVDGLLAGELLAPETPVRPKARSCYQALRSRGWLPESEAPYHLYVLLGDKF